jgi:hypothetical protein
VFEDERGLVIYHNCFADTRGWIKVSAAYLDKVTGDLRQKSLAEALGLPFEGFVIFKDYVTHLEYIRSCEDLWQKGMYLELQAYQHQVFMDWRFVDDERWREIYVVLNGAGVESMQARWDEMFAEKKEEVKVKKPRKKAAVKKTASTKPRAPRKKKPEGVTGETVTKKTSVKKAVKPTSDKK